MNDEPFYFPNAKPAPAGVAKPGDAREGFDRGPSDLGITFDAI
jgi:hypothetical protein